MIDYIDILLIKNYDLLVILNLNDLNFHYNIKVWRT